jgi:hypothetical protein
MMVSVRAHVIGVLVVLIAGLGIGSVLASDGSPAHGRVVGNGTKITGVRLNVVSK